MRVFVGQIYISPGISFPLTLHFQKWLGEELTNRIEPSEEFQRAYPGDFDLGFRLSAKSEIREPEIKGPTVFKRDKNVEFTIFLPYRAQAEPESDRYRWLMELLLDSIVQVLLRLRIEPTKVRDSASELIERFIASPAMIASK